MFTFSLNYCEISSDFASISYWNSYFSNFLDIKTFFKNFQSTNAKCIVLITFTKIHEHKWNYLEKLLNRSKIYKAIKEFFDELKL